MKELTNREKLTVLKFDLIKLILRGKGSDELSKHLASVNSLLKEYETTGNINTVSMNNVEEFVSFKSR